MFPFLWFLKSFLPCFPPWEQQGYFIHPPGSEEAACGKIRGDLEWSDVCTLERVWALEKHFSLKSVFFFDLTGCTLFHSQDVEDRPSCPAAILP